MKKWLAIIGAVLVALAVTTPTVKADSFPDGKIRAFTKTSPAGGPVVSAFSCVDLGDGNLLLAFVIQGHGVWTLSCISDTNQQVLMAEGVASANPQGNIDYCIVPATGYATCVFSLGNVHGWFGPGL